MTIHQFLEPFELGTVKRIPADVTFHQLAAYALARWGWKMIQEGNRVKRVCPCCNR